MKRTILFCCAVLVLFGAINSQSSSATALQPAAEQVSTVPLYGINVSLKGGTRPPLTVFTASPTEKAETLNQLKTKIYANYNVEDLGIVGHVFNREMPNTLPLYKNIKHKSLPAEPNQAARFVIEQISYSDYKSEGAEFVCYISRKEMPGMLTLYVKNVTDISSIGGGGIFGSVGTPKSYPYFYISGEKSDMETEKPMPLGYLWKEPTALPAGITIMPKKINMPPIKPKGKEDTRIIKPNDK